MAAGSILNNISALSASRQLGITSSALDKTIQRLTTGRRINMASDDAAGLAISNRLNADIRVSNQARRNAQDGIAYLSVADGALEEVTALLTRASELAQQAQTGTISSTNRLALDLEFQVIADAIQNVAQNAVFNSTSVFRTDQIHVAVASFSKVEFTIGTMKGDMKPATGSNTYSITDTTAAGSAQTKLDAMIQEVSMQRATIGSRMQYLNTISNTLGIQVENFTAANSQIQDANIADEVIALTKFQILGQSGTSALAQSNQAAQLMLGLLR
jgi:flagellin